MEKILVFSNMYPSEAHPTYGIFVKNQVTSLRDEGLDVEVVAITDPAKGKWNSIKKYGSFFIKGIFQMLRKRKELSLTHAHYAFPTGLLSYFGKIWFGIPYVITVHGGDIDKMSKKNKTTRNWTETILRKADEVIVVGEQLKEDVIQQFDISMHKVSVISMGVDPTVFHVMPQELSREALEVSKEETMILYVGNIIREKGILELIEAYKQILYSNERLSLYLVGSQKDEQFVTEVQDRITNLSRVHLIDPQPQGKLAKWMSAADVFVLPSYHEGFGLVALEAMAVGVPVVGTNVGGIPFLLKEDAGILVEPQDSKSLADGISAALERSEERYTEVKQAIVEEHSYPVLMQKLLTIYRVIGKN